MKTNSYIFAGANYLWSIVIFRDKISPAISGDDLADLDKLSLSLRENVKKFRPPNFTIRLLDGDNAWVGTTH